MPQREKHIHYSHKKKNLIRDNIEDNQNMSPLFMISRFKWYL